MSTNDDKKSQGGMRVLFPPPGFFLTDITVQLYVDGVLAYEGGFKAGLDVAIDAAPGMHRLESVIDVGLLKRRRSWTVQIPPPGATVELQYSRMWGNFENSVAVIPARH